MGGSLAGEHPFRLFVNALKASFAVTVVQNVLLAILILLVYL